MANFDRAMGRDQILARRGSQLDGDQRRRGRDEAVDDNPGTRRAAAPSVRPSQAGNLESADFGQYVERVGRVRFWFTA